MNIDFAKSDDVRHKVRDGVLYVCVDRAEKRNPLSLGVLQQLADIFTRHACDPGIRMAVVTAAGEKAFASGGDLLELADMRSTGEARALSLHGKAALNAIRTFPLPVVARVNGVALGGGAELALACDLRFAAAHASIGFIHSRLAISPSWGGGVDLVRLVGSAAAVRLMSRAEILNVEEALALGLFDGVADPDEDFETAFEAYIVPMRQQSPQVMRAIKALAAARNGDNIAYFQSIETDQFATTWPHPDHWRAVESNLHGQRSRGF